MATHAAVNSATIATSDGGGSASTQPVPAAARATVQQSGRQSGSCNKCTNKNRPRRECTAAAEITRSYASSAASGAATRSIGAIGAHIVSEEQYDERAAGSALLELHPQELRLLRPVERAVGSDPLAGP